jgi:hypothetical protein
VFAGQNKPAESGKACDLVSAFISAFGIILGSMTHVVCQKQNIRIGFRHCLLRRNAHTKDSAWAFCLDRLLSSEINCAVKSL